MIRKLVLVIALFLSLSAGAAAESAYWTVVDDTAPASDVVLAANFAASMKGSVAVAFTGKTLSQARAEVITQDLEDAVIVIFDGMEVTIIADEAKFPLVVEGCEVYLQRQGFTVEKSPPDMRILLGEPAPIDNTEPEDEEVPVAAAPEPEVFEHEPVVRVDADDAPEDSPEPEEMPEPEKKPNVFTRVWRWFADLF